MIRFLIELLVRRTWFGQSKLYFVLSWLVMRCKLRPELAADAQQTAWSKMKAKVKSIYFHHLSQGNSTNNYLILGLRDKAAPPTSQQINKFPPKRVKNLATPSSIVICIFFFIHRRALLSASQRHWSSSRALTRRTLLNMVWSVLAKYLWPKRSIFDRVIAAQGFVEVTKQVLLCEVLAKWSKLTTDWLVSLWCDRVVGHYLLREVSSCTVHSSGAVWESRWPSWAVRPNEPSGFRGRKVILNHASALVSACP